jgi:oligopeptide/dipeptide ABC transporter ATP-binding protein
VLKITDVHVHYPVGRRMLRAVDGVSLEVAAGETLGIVGESGCGKSTLAKAVLGLVKPVQGSVSVDGQNPAGLSGAALLAFRRNVQMVFQDPYASLSPRRTILQSLLEPLEVHHIGADRAERLARAEATLDSVGLDRDSLRRYPHEFSGGQRQRIGIARAIIADPKLVILDEPVSALDISVRAQVINLLADIQRSRNVGYMFIGHDLALMRHVTDRVAVMYLGRVVELGTTAEIFDNPQHPYTRSLILSAPSPDPTKRRTTPALEGDPPSPLDIPEGCRFQARCDFKSEHCLTDDPQLIQLGDTRRIACHNSGTLPMWSGG